jgi:hypothetical protein
MCVGFVVGVPCLLTPYPSCNTACRWYATQALPLVFIGGLVCFLAVDAGRVSQPVRLAAAVPCLVARPLWEQDGIGAGSVVAVRLLLRKYVL